jgi:hypothetical protein
LRNKAEVVSDVKSSIDNLLSFRSAIEKLLGDADGK